MFRLTSGGSFLPLHSTHFVSLDVMFRPSDASACNRRVRPRERTQLGPRRHLPFLACCLHDCSSSFERQSHRLVGGEKLSWAMHRGTQSFLSFFAEYYYCPSLQYINASRDSRVQTTNGHVWVGPSTNICKYATAYGSDNDLHGRCTSHQFLQPRWRHEFGELQNVSAEEWKAWRGKGTCQLS